MAGPRKYPDELREPATRMAVELRQDAATEQGAIALVAEQLGMHLETSRKCVRQAEIDGDTRPGTTSAEAQRITAPRVMESRKPIVFRYYRTWRDPCIRIRCSSGPAAGRSVIMFS